jgi:hypothetical protein
MREEEIFCKVGHLLAKKKTHFLPHGVIKLRATFLVLQLTIKDSHFSLRTNVLMSEFWCEITVKEESSM